MSDLRMEEQEDKTQSTTTTTATTTATIATTLTTSTTTSTSSSSSSSIITPVIKDEPVDSISQEVQMPLTSVNEDDNDGRICTPESQANDAVRGFLSKCIFCSKIFNSDDEAKLLECLHAACSSCIQAKLKDHSLYVDSEVVVEGNIVICQECNVESQFDNLIDNKFNVKFIDDDLHTDDDSKESDDEKICTSCHDNATATSWCDNCEEFICQNCVMAHQRLKITKEHTIRPKNEITNSNDTPKKSKKSSLYLFCSVHRHEQLSLFCQTCDRLTCRDCQLTDHRDHKYKFTHEIATETRGSVAKLLKEVTYKRVLLKSAMKVIEDRQVLILEKKKTLVQDITQMVVQLTNAINTRGKQLVMRLNEVCDLKQNTLNEKKIALDQLSKLTDHCIQFVNYALDKGSDMELLYSKKSVTGHLQRIKNRRADIPNPEIPVRINLSLEKVQDLIKVVSSIGAIVVDGRVYPSVSPSSRTSTPTTPSIDIQDAIKLTSSIAGNTSNTSDCPILPIAPQQMTTIAHGNTYSGVQLTFTNPQLQQQQQQSQSLVNPMQQPSSPIQSQNYLSTHYTNHPMPPNRTSPQAPQQHQQPRIPYNINFNGNIRQQLLLPQQRPMGQQQVTSSTHPQQQQQQQAQQQQQQQMHIDHQNASLRGLLAPFQRSINPNHNMAYRLPPSYRYPAGNPQIRASISHTYQPTNPGLVSGGRVQQIPQGQLPSYPIQQSPVTAAVATVTATVTTASIAASASSAAARWHIPQGTNNTMQYYNQRQSHQQQQQQPQIQQQQSQQNQQLLQQQHQLQQLQQQQFQLQQLQQYQQQSSLQIPGAGTPNDTFKIILKSQQNNIMPKNMTGGGTVVTDASSLSIGLRLGQAVSSSVPKTPSPIPGKSDETEKRLDNFCQKSLNDLLQTIAKLDSNGIVIIPEEHKNQLDSSHVDSSTDEGINNISENTGDISKDEQMTMTKDDPNEDWCAVCMDGGDAVLCCDRCPKVFHLYCHIPSLNTFPDESETWQCMLCTNILDCTENSSRIDKRSHSMNPKDLRIAQRIVLELYCQHEQSLPFREVVSYDITEYHKLIKKPIALDVIKKKLRHDDSNSYTDLREVLADIRLMFKNAYIFNPVDSQVYKEARNLEEFFEKLLVKWAPDYAIEYPSLALDDDDEVFPPNRKYRRIIND